MILTHIYEFAISTSMQKPTTTKQVSQICEAKLSHIYVYCYDFAALMLAVQNGKYDVITELFNLGAIADIPNDSEKTLLNLAEKQSNYFKKYADNVKQNDIHKSLLLLK